MEPLAEAVSERFEALIARRISDCKLGGAPCRA
jgi:hypothetical protein